MTGHPSRPQAHRRRARAVLRAAVLALVASSLGGCMFSAKNQDLTASVPTDYRLRHPIAVKEAERTVELLVGARRGSLSATQRGEVVAFAQGWHREATGGVIIDVPSGTPNARAAADALREVRAILAGAAIPSGAVQARGYRPADPARLATVRLNYPHMTAQAGPCGLWPEDIGPTTEAGYTHNRPYSNLGCASQRNLAAMVANPSDLVQPRSEAPIYSARRSTALEKYRKGESPATVYPDASKSTISDVGK